MRAVILAILLCGLWVEASVAEQNEKPDGAAIHALIRDYFPSGVASTAPEEIEFLERSDEKVVVAMPLMAKAVSFDNIAVPEEKISCYVHLSRVEGVWKVSGMRTAYPGYVRYLAFLAREAPKYDEVARQNRLIALLGLNGLIATETDQKMMEHFRKNQDTFEAIRKNITARPAEMPSRIEQDASELGRLLTEAGIGYADHSVDAGVLVNPDDPPETGCYGGGCFTLALVFVPPEFKVGYFHVDQEQRVPPMRLREFFVIRPLGNGWHFFRQA